MKRTNTTTLLAFIAAMLLMSISPAAKGQAPLYEANSLLIKFKENATSSKTAALKERLKPTGIKPIANTGIEKWILPDLKSSPKGSCSPDIEAIVNDFANNPIIELAEPNYYHFPQTPLYPNDPNYGNQYALSLINAPAAHGIRSTSSDIVIAILDTGIDWTHPDLAGNIWINPADPPNGIDDDGNGKIDDSHGWNFFDKNNDIMDYNGHGTQVAGIIGAIGNNNIGISGITWDVQLLPLKFMGNITTVDEYGNPVQTLAGTSEDAILALEYAKGKGVRISNNSWGSRAYSQLLKDAIADLNQEGHLFVAASGTTGASGLFDNDQTPFYPASFDLDNIISVMSSNEADELSNYSTYGQTSVDLAAPGQDILTTNIENTYTEASGSSMAAPQVTGAAALLLARYPYLSALEIKEQIMNTVDPIAAFATKCASGGRLNLHNGLIPAPNWPLTYQITLGGHLSDSGADLVQTTDGNFLLVGTSRSFPKSTGEVGDQDILVALVDSFGIEIWSRRYGGIGDDIGLSIIEDKDGNFVICGRTQSYGAGGWDIYVIKTDSNGDEIWSKTYGGSGHEYAYQLIESIEGGYALVSNNFLSSSILKIDELGIVEWDKSYKVDSYGDTRAYCITQAKDGRYALSGVVRNWPSEMDIFLLVTDSLGNIQNSSTYGRRGDPIDWRNWDQGRSIATTKDAGFIITGETNLQSSVNTNIYIIKTDSTGSQEWGRVLGNGTYEFGRDIIQTNDGGYVFTAIISQSHQYDNDGVGIVKLDAAGNTLWVERFNGPSDSHDMINDVIQTADGGLAFTGSMGTAKGGSSDLWLTIVAENGVGSCNDVPRTLVRADTITQIFYPSNIVSDNDYNATAINSDYSFAGTVQDIICSTVLCDVVAAFKVDETQCGVGMLNFINQSENATSYTWKVNGEIEGSSQNFSLPFSLTAERQVITLHASNDNCADVYNVVLPNLVPDTNFSNSIDGFQATFHVNADSSTLIPTTYDWDFGDGNTATGYQVEYEYASNGTFNVCLTVSNACTSSTECRGIIVATETSTAVIIHGDSNANASNSNNGGQPKLLPTTDGGILSIGRTTDSLGNANILITKLSNTGAILWTRDYGGNLDDIAKDIIEIDDGFLLLGDTRSYHSNNVDYLLVKLDLTGNLLWTKTYGDTTTATISGYEKGNEFSNSITILPDGNYLLSGYSVAGFNGRHIYNKTYLVKVDVDGNELWAKYYNPTHSTNHSNLSTTFTNDGKILLSGYYGGGTDNYWNLMLSDTNGVLLSNKRISPTLGQCYSTIQTSDGGNALFGYSSSSGFSYEKMLLIKLDSQQNILWSKMYGGTGFNYGRKVIETADGGFLMVGYSNSSNIGAQGYDAYLVKTDSEGNEEWAKLYNLGSNEYAYDVHELADGYILTGYTQNGPLGDSDIFVITTDFNGNVQCDNVDAPRTEVAVQMLLSDLTQLQTANIDPTEMSVTPSTQTPSTLLANRCQSGCLADFSYPSATICAGSEVAFANNSTAGTFTWEVNGAVVSTDSNLVYNFTEAGTYEIKLYVYDAAISCADFYTATIAAKPLAADLDLEANIDTCEPQIQLDAGDDYVFYLWDKDGSFFSNEQSPTLLESGLYTLGVQDHCGNTHTASINVNLGGGCVWPGDTDNDGRVDVFDLLPLGLSHGSTGPSRPNATTNWQGQYSADWSTSYGKYEDCNGDGTIDFDDTNVIVLNYDKMHDTYNNPPFQNKASDLVLVPMLSKLKMQGDSSYLEIYFVLKHQNGNDFSIYGAAWKYDIPVNTLYPYFDNSLLSNSSEINTYKHLPNQGVDMGITHTDQMDALGQGILARLVVTEIEIPIGTNTTLSDNATSISLKDLKIVTADGSPVDACGCDAALYFDEGTDIDSTGVQNPDVLALLLNACPTNCGSLSADIYGGTAPYSYAWSDGSSSKELYDVDNGLYFCTVTDALGQQQQGYIYFEYESTAAACRQSFQVELEVTDMACTVDELSQTQGSILANAYGGIPPYDYTWSNGETTASIAGLAPGSYLLTLTDANGTSNTATTEIHTPFLAEVVDTTPVMCATGGSVTISATGGQAPFTYNIIDFYSNTPPLIFSSGPTSDSSYTFIGLPLGTYNVVVFDANDCQAYCSGPFDIIQDDRLTAELTIQDASCPAEVDGSALVTATCGQAPFAFLWSTGETTASISGLAADIYWVTVSDGLGDALVLEAIVGEPAELFLDYGTTIATTCGLDNGSVVLNGYGGTQPYTFTIFGINTNYTATSQNTEFGDLPADIYLASFVDANGCTYSCPLGFEIDDSIDSHAEVSTTETCYGLAEGTIKICDTAPFDYLINGYNAGWSADPCILIENLPSGGYDILVTDANGCSTTSWVEVAQREYLSFDAVADGCDRSILVTVASGTGPSFDLSVTTYGASGGTTLYTLSDSLLLENLPYDTYYLDMMDDFGCNCTPIVVNLDPPTTCTLPIFQNFKLYPTLTKSQVKVEYQQGETASGSLRIYSVAGVLVQEIPLENQEGLLEIEVSAWPIGTYYVKFGAFEVKRFVVIR